MSKTKELLLECKVKLGVQTDYKLAKNMDLHTARISAYMAGKETPDNYAAVRIALILKRDPAEIIAEIEADTTKNEKKRAFWLDFLQRAKKAAQWGTLGAIFICSLLGGHAHEVGGFRRSKIFA
jgi:hypothetical protein